MRLMQRSTGLLWKKCQAAEGQLGRTTKLTEAVARYLFKLMAYKDEYEVARLHLDPPSPKRLPTCLRATTSWCTTWRHR